MSDRQRLGERLAGHRRQRGWSLREAARRSGWTAQYLNLIELGDTAAPPLGRLRELAKMLEVPPSPQLAAQIVMERLLWELSSPASGDAASQVAQAIVLAQAQTEAGVPFVVEWDRPKMIGWLMGTVESITVCWDRVLVTTQDGNSVTIDPLHN